jgi:glucose-6-phosphate isomerase
MKTATELWNKYTETTRYYPSVGLSLDISRMNYPDGFLESQSQNVQAALKAMEELERGAIANPDEQRMVGHYWLRTPELAPVELQTAIRQGIEAAKSFSEEVHYGSIKPPSSSRFRNLLVIGIGGSALGPQLISDAFGDLYHGEVGLKVYFMDNTDPDGIHRILRSIRLQETLVAVLSKSGGTAETRNGMLETEAAYKKIGLHFGSHAIAVTMPGSALDNYARQNDWLRIFDMFDWVGGRTSLLSAVGLIPMALEGIPFEEVLSGAREMDAVTRSATDNPAMTLALMWYYAGSGKGLKDMVILPYKDRLVLFSKYLQQLVMESLGKEKNLKGETVYQGLAVYGNKGSTDQHAYVQQLRDGINNFFATFIEVLSDFTVKADGCSELEVKEKVRTGDYLHGFYLGTRSALYENGRESITITIDKLSPRSLGSLIALYERAVGFYASLIGVNAYHQPGVEAGKKAAERILDLEQKLLALGVVRGATAEELAIAINESDSTEAVYKVMSHLAQNGRGVTLERGENPATDIFTLGETITRLQ